MVSSQNFGPVLGSLNKRGRPQKDHHLEKLPYKGPPNSGPAIIRDHVTAQKLDSEG